MFKDEIFQSNNFLQFSKLYFRTRKSQKFTHYIKSNPKLENFNTYFFQILKGLFIFILKMSMKLKMLLNQKSGCRYARITTFSSYFADVCKQQY